MTNPLKEVEDLTDLVKKLIVQNGTMGMSSILTKLVLIARQIDDYEATIANTHLRIEQSEKALERIEERTKQAFLRQKARMDIHQNLIEQMTDVTKKT